MSDPIWVYSVAHPPENIGTVATGVARPSTSAYAMTALCGLYIDVYDMFLRRQAADSSRLASTLTVA